MNDQLLLLYYKINCGFFSYSLPMQVRNDLEIDHAVEPMTNETIAINKFSI